MTVDGHDTATKPRVYICVLNWNSGKQILACLASLFALDYPDFTVTVVDNASTDESVVLLRNSYPNLPILISGSNLGYGGGNALALPDAIDQQADLFWIVNPDAMVAPDALSRLVDGYERHGDALYGGIGLFKSGDQNRWQVRFQSWKVEADGRPNLSKRMTFAGDYAVVFRDQRERPVASLSGASLLIPMSVISKYGFIDPDFFLYSEETDCSLRLAQHDIRSYLMPASIIYHQPQGAHKHDKALKPVVIYYQTRNRLTILRRYGSRPAYILGSLRALVNALAWAALTPLQGYHALKIAGMTLRAIYHAARGQLGPTFVPEGAEQTSNEGSPK